MVSLKRISTKQLGELLIERKVITQEHLQKALDYQKVNGGLIGEIFVANMIPASVARQYCLIPIDKIGNNLTVAMSNPLNTQAIEDVEMASKCIVQAFVSTTSDIRRAIEKCYAKK